jgi:hypothetical protein
MSSNQPMAKGEPLPPIDARETAQRIEVTIWGGPSGPAGPPGAGIQIKGTAETWPPANAPSDGDLWVIPSPPPEGTPEGFAPGDGAVWDGEQWVDTGPIQGPPGESIDCTHVVSDTTPPPADHVGDLWVWTNAPEVELPAGPPGPEGPQGPAGEAATIDVDSTTTIDAGLPAEVVNVGTSSRALLAFKIPRGEPGAAGEPGPAGADGIAGPAGPQGEQGIQGVQGEQGIQGDQGIPGPAGPSGPAGETGAQGAGVRLRGSISTYPPQDAAPVDGDLWLVHDPDGPPVDASFPAGTAEGDGFVWDGLAWINVGPIRGPEGPAGVAGPAGEQGERGPEGPQGIQGAQGIPGPAGPSAVSADAGNASTLGSDGFVFTPAAKTLTPATATVLGGVKIGSGIAVTADGTISVSASGTAYLPLAGGTMTGTINVPNGINFIQTASNFCFMGSTAGVTVRSGTTNLLAFGLNSIDAFKPIALPADPTTALQAATKQYVDSRVATVPTGFLPLAGGTMTGTINVPAGEPAIKCENAWIGSDGTNVSVVSDSNYLTVKAGEVVAGSPLTLPGDPTQPLEAATKQYVDSKSSTYTLPAATATTLGGVKAGSGIAVTADGTISVSGGTGNYTLPTASAGTLGGIKIGNGLTIDSNGVCAATLAGNYVNKAGDVMNGPLRYAANAGPAGFNGTDVYTYYDGAYYRLYMPGGKQAFVAAPDTAQVQFLGANPQTPFTPAVDNDLANKKYVDGAIAGSTAFLKLTGGTMTGTVVAPTAVNTMTWAGTYNLLGSSGGVAIRTGTTNLLLATTASVAAVVLLEVRASGAAIRFGSAGPTITNVSNVVSVSANVESTAAAPTAAGHLTRKDYVDGNFAPKALLDEAIAEIRSLRAEVAAMKAQVQTDASKKRKR